MWTSYESHQSGEGTFHDGQIHASVSVFFNTGLIEEVAKLYTAQKIRAQIWIFTILGAVLVQAIFDIFPMLNLPPEWRELLENMLNSQEAKPLAEFFCTR